MGSTLVGSRLKALRIKAGYTQQQAADFMRLKNKSTLASWESGKSEPDVITFLILWNFYMADYESDIMKALNVDANYLFQDSFKSPTNSKKPATHKGSELDDNEQSLIDIYRDLTKPGQITLLSAASGLHSTFKKSDTISADVG